MTTRWVAVPFLMVFLLGILGKAQATGSLTIVTEPSAEIRWQGVSIGLADEEGRLVIHGIPRGSYSILAVKNGFLAQSEEVEIQQGRQEIGLTLTPLADNTLPLNVPTDSPEVDPVTGADAPTDNAETDRPDETTTDPEELVPVTEEPDPASDPTTLPSAPLSESDRSTLDPALEDPPSSAERDPELRPNEDASESSRRPESTLRVPPIIPTAPDQESDLRIVIWWAMGLIVVLFFLRTVTRNLRRERAEKQQNEADFTRALSAKKEEQN